MTIEELFQGAMRDALAAVLERQAAQVKPEQAGPLGMDVKEAAAYLGVAENAMRDLCHSKGFPAMKVGGKYLISRAGLEAWLEDHTKGEGRQHYEDGLHYVTPRVPRNRAGRAQ